jgi:WD40 repeat protein
MRKQRIDACIGGRYGKVCLYDLKNDKLIKEFRNNCGVNTIKWSSDGKNIIAGDSNGKIILWNCY